MTVIERLPHDDPAVDSWPKSIAWRRVLPLVQMALAIALFSAAYEHNRLLDARLAVWTAQHANPAEGEAAFWDPRMMFGYIDPPLAVLYAINLPASLIALPVALIGLLLEHFGYQSHHLGDFAFLASVPLLWYWIGRALDRRMGTIPTPHKPTQCSQVTRFILWIAFGMLLLMALLGFAGGITNPHGWWFRLTAAAMGVWSTIFAELLRRRLTGSSRN